MLYLVAFFTGFSASFKHLAAHENYYGYGATARHHYR